MLRFLFSRLAAPVFVDFGCLRRDLGLDHERFADDPKAHIAVLEAVGDYTLRGSAQYGPARSCYADPKRVLTMKPQESQFSDAPQEPEEKIRSSACLSYTEEQRGFGKRHFALTIRRESATIEEMEQSLVFGLSGIYDREGRMKILRILAPSGDGRNGVTAAHPIPLTVKNVQRALFYARCCADNLYEGRSLMPQVCLADMMRHDPVLQPAA